MASLFLNGCSSFLNGGLHPGNQVLRRPLQRLAISNGTIHVASMNRKGESYQVEVVLREEDAPEVALKRFRIASRGTNIVMEARRRGHFENGQDRKKRKMKEGHMKKAFEKKFRWKESTLSEQSNAMEPAPFSEMFGGNTDIFGEGEGTIEVLRR